jgi:hypothetical protein
MNTTRLVIDDKILLAASSLPAEGFTAEELVAAAFEKFPEDFCLMGFPHYPDSNKVLTQITTAGRGLQKRGWLHKIGTKRYQLTGESLRHLEKLGRPGLVQAVRPDNRDVADLILHWRKSDTYAKASIGRLDAISEREALGFWRLTSGATAARTHRELTIANSAIQLLTTAISNDSTSQIHHDRSLSPSDARKLVETHKYLIKKFSEALDYLRSQRR